MTSAPLGNPVSCPGGTSLRWYGWQTAFELKQEGSALTIVDYNRKGDDLKGVLHDDLSVAFEPIKGVARGENGAEDAPGRLFFVGQFRDGAPPSFAGTHTFVKDADHCTIKAGVSWTRSK
jgi:hypothetical protein